jgi:hypothetical protein
VTALLLSESGMITLTEAGEHWFHPAAGIVPTVLCIGLGFWLCSVRVNKERITCTAATAGS